jgi:hypothetical protein
MASTRPTVRTGITYISMFTASFDVLSQQLLICRER